MKQTLLILVALISINCFGQGTLEPDVFYRFKLSNGNYVLLPEKEVDILLDNKLVKIHYNEDVLTISNNTSKLPDVEKQAELAKLEIEPLMFLWEVYSNECYNDSTLFERSHYLPEGEYSCTMTLMLPSEINYCTKETHYRKYWMHKPTNSFPDFMEWLKTKYEN